MTEAQGDNNPSASMLAQYVEHAGPGLPAARSLAGSVAVTLDFVETYRRMRTDTRARERAPKVPKPAEGCARLQLAPGARARRHIDTICFFKTDRSLTIDWRLQEELFWGGQPGRWEGRACGQVRACCAHMPRAFPRHPGRMGCREGCASPA